MPGKTHMKKGGLWHMIMHCLEQFISKSGPATQQQANTSPAADNAAQPASEMRPSMPQAALGDAVSRKPPDPMPDAAGQPTVEVCPIIINTSAGQPDTLQYETKAIDWRRFNMLRSRPSPVHDTLIDGWENACAVVRGASIRGYDHRHSAEPRQDCFALASIPRNDWVVAVVADGVSQACQSQIGSETAVCHAVEWFLHNEADSLDAIDWEGLLDSVAHALVEKARELENPAASREDAVSILATTMVCAAIAPSPQGLDIALVSIGDSSAWIVDNDGFHAIAGGKAYQGGGSISSEVDDPLPRRSGRVDALRAAIFPGHALLLGTDGFGTPLGDGDGPLGAVFRAMLLGKTPTQIEFANTLDFHKGNFGDDRTLVAVWPK